MKTSGVGYLPFHGVPRPGNTVTRPIGSTRVRCTSLVMIYIIPLRGRSGMVSPFMW